MTADTVAVEAGCNPRLVREWLDGQAAGPIVSYDAASDRYELSAEAALVVADDTANVFGARAMNNPAAMFMDLDQIVAAFRGDGALRSVSTNFADPYTQKIEEFAQTYCSNKWGALTFTGTTS